METHTYPLTDEEIAQAASLLAKLEPGYLPRPLFDQITRLSVTPTLILVPLRRGTDGLEVLLIKRPEGDPVWPGRWDISGVILRPTDTDPDYADAINRILRGELKNQPVVGEPTFVRSIFTDSERGRELNLLYYIEVTGEANIGQFFPADSLPDHFLEHEKTYPAEAAQAFLENTQ